MDDYTQHELAQIRHELNNLRFVVNDYHFPRKIRDAMAKRITELEAKRNAIYERQFHITVTRGN